MDIQITRHQLRTLLATFEPSTENDWKVYDDCWTKLNSNGEILCEDVDKDLWRIGKKLGS